MGVAVEVGIVGDVRRSWRWEGEMVGRYDREEVGVEGGGSGGWGGRAEKEK